MVKSCANDQTHLDNVIRNLNVDKDLKNILAQASQTDSHRRYANMHAFAEDLDNYLSNKPVNATSPSWFYRVNKFAKRRSALFATIMTLIFTVTLGFIILTNQYQKTLVAEQKAVEVKNFMLDSFRSTNPNLNKGVEVTAKDLLKASAEKLKNETKLDKEIQFEILQTLGIAYGSIGVPDQAIDLLKKSLLIQPENSKSLSYLAMYLFDNTDTETHQAYLKTINIEKFTSNLDKARVLRVKAKINARDSEFDTAMLNLNKVLASHV
jgi:tetratricopeptide (TPR) repeat protein